jgi:hypothetical protein
VKLVRLSSPWKSCGAEAATKHIWGIFNSTEQHLDTDQMTQSSHNEGCMQLVETRQVQHGFGAGGHQFTPVVRKSLLPQLAFWKIAPLVWEAGKDQATMGWRCPGTSGVEFPPGVEPVTPFSSNPQILAWQKGWQELLSVATPQGMSTHHLAPDSPVFMLPPRVQLLGLEWGASHTPPHPRGQHHRGPIRAGCSP